MLLCDTPLTINVFIIPSLNIHFLLYHFVMYTAVMHISCFIEKTKDQCNRIIFVASNVFIKKPNKYTLSSVSHKKAAPKLHQSSTHTVSTFSRRRNNYVEWTTCFWASLTGVKRFWKKATRLHGRGVQFLLWLWKTMNDPTVHHFYQLLPFLNVLR